MQCVPAVGELGYEPRVHGLLYTTVNCAANSFPYVSVLPRVWELCSDIPRQTMYACVLKGFNYLGRLVWRAFNPFTEADYVCLRSQVLLLCVCVCVCLCGVSLQTLQ